MVVNNFFFLPFSIPTKFPNSSDSFLTALNINRWYCSHFQVKLFVFVFLYWNVFACFTMLGSRSGRAALAVAHC